MAGDPFYYFGSGGAYNVAQQTTLLNTATSTAVTSLGLFGGMGYAGLGAANQFHTAVTYVTEPSALAQYATQASKPAAAAKKKIKGLVASLRAEIDGWHGDILERCPA